MLPKIPLGDWVETIVNLANIYLAGFFDFVRIVLNALVVNSNHLLLSPHPLIFILIATILVWIISRRGIAIGTAIGLFLIYNMGLWEPSIESLTLVLTATIVALFLGIPIGIMTAWSNKLHAFVSPTLDLMQTMPPFVYLIPAVFFFSIGNVPGVIATVIFAMPPAVRLTNLGIRQVPLELLEAAEAFGSTRLQKLVKVQLPLALPTIMAGINQVIMLSLSMVVIAAMIGARGLGREVLRAIGRLDVAMGFEGGLAVVIIAIILDRVMQNLRYQERKQQTNN